MTPDSPRLDPAGGRGSRATRRSPPLTTSWVYSHRRRYPGLRLAGGGRLVNGLLTPGIPGSASMTEDERASVARHEAGHAVIARALGFTVRDVWLHATGGVTDTRHPDRDRLVAGIARREPESIAFAEDAATIVLAGGAVDGADFGWFLPVASEPPDHDVQRALRMLVRLHGSEDAAMEAGQRLVERAGAFVIAHEAEIARLAAALLAARGHLDGEQLEAALAP